MKNNYEELEILAKEEMESARENDYAWYFHILTEQIPFDRDGEGELLGLYDEHWPKVREAIKKDYYSVTADGILAKPSPDFMFSLRDNIQMFYGNIINDIDMALNNAKRYEDRATFAKDCLELFDMYEGDGSLSLNYMNFSLAIGEAYSDAGKVEESDAWYEKLLAEYPDNGYMIANYVLTLKMRGEKAKAKELLENHISPDMEPVKENEMLFERARELYEEEGNNTLADRYKKLQDQIYRNGKRINPGEFMSADKPKTVVHTEKKIYPNDPCPCGSGKKYKKCCGRK